MKKIMFILVVVSMLFAVGCSKEWYEHDTVYKTNQHMYFSLFGYKSADSNDANTQNDQDGWWGEPVPVK